MPQCKPPKSEHNPIRQAQSEIAATLKRLEEETGQTVKSLELQMIDASSIHGESAIVQVKIEMYRVPGRDWA